MNSTPPVPTNSEMTNKLEETATSLKLLTLNGENSEKNDALNNGVDLNDAVGNEKSESDGKSEGHVNKFNKSASSISVLSKPDAPYYYRKYKYRGHCLIFNHFRFDKETRLGERSGTQQDRNRARFLFEKLGFNVHVFDDLTVKDIRRQLEHYKWEVDHTDCDCFAVVFMSHGEDGVLYGRDSMLKSEDLYLHFTPDNCPSLAGKPKMFFIQACRGEGLDSGVQLQPRKSYDETDNGGLTSYRIPIHADFLLCWSTVPGHYSWRNTTNGSWFIQSLVEVFGKQANTLDVLSMMTNVNRHMILKFESNCPSQENMHGKKQTACIISTLMRQVYLTPKQ